jgi:hypothetical protein
MKATAEQSLENGKILFLKHTIMKDTVFNPTLSDKGQ